MRYECHHADASRSNNIGLIRPSVCFCVRYYSPIHQLILLKRRSKEFLISAHAEWIACVAPRA